MCTAFDNCVVLVQHMWSLTTVLVAVLMVCMEFDNKVVLIECVDLDNNADSDSMCVKLLKIALVLMVCMELNNKVVLIECVDLENNADSDSMCVSY